MRFDTFGEALLTRSTALVKGDPRDGGREALAGTGKLSEEVGYLAREAGTSITPAEEISSYSDSAAARSAP